MLPLVLGCLSVRGTELFFFFFPPFLQFQGIERSLKGILYYSNVCNCFSLSKEQHMPYSTQSEHK